MAKTKEEKFQVQLKRLQNLAVKAAAAQDRLYDALEKAKARKDWEEFCEVNSISPECNYGDWLA